MYLVVLYIFFGLLCQLTIGAELSNKKFPNDFMFGCTLSAYEIEGAWNESGKGLSIWDTVSHRQPPIIANGDTGDIACDSYHRYKEDVAMLAKLGVNHYRFSISWSRLLPTGQPNNINEAGVTYYQNLIKELKKNNIEPFVTLLHYDTPQVIEDMGGWTHPEFADWFADYARLCFKLFGDNVKYWVTFNEARLQCVLGYAIGYVAPMKSSPGVGEYMCIHHMLRAHAAAWHVYNDEFRATQKGNVGVSIDSDWYEPYKDGAEYLKASENMLLFQFGIFGHPLYFGDYPDLVKKTIERRSLAQRYTKSRLPVFTDADKIKLKGTLDFIGLNMFKSSAVGPITSENLDRMGLTYDCEITNYHDIYNKAWGLNKLVKWLNITYNDVPIIITENGYGDESSTRENLDDPVRITYLQEHVSAIRDAMDDGVNIKGYTVCNCMDSFQFRSGYNLKYGLHHVDFTNPNRTRTPRSSAAVYKKLIETRCLVDSCIKT